MLARNRAIPGTLYDTSHDPCSRNAVNACLLFPSRSPAMRRVSSTDMTGSSRILTAIRRPLTSICGGLPGEKIRSLTLGALRSITASKPFVDTPPAISEGTVLGAAASAALAMFSLQEPKDDLAGECQCGGIFNVAKKPRVQL